jgi:hypothetical protein
MYLGVASEVALRQEYFKLHVEQMQQPPEFELPQRRGKNMGKKAG